MIAWSKRNRQARAKIRKRRDVQFETFKFAQKRLSDNRTLYSSSMNGCARLIDSVWRRGGRSRRSAAAMAASQAQEMLSRCGRPRVGGGAALLQDFAEDARAQKPSSRPRRTRFCEDLERQRRQEMADTASRVARDKRQLEKTAEAAVSRSAAELAKTKARLSETRGSRSSRWSA